MSHWVLQSGFEYESGWGTLVETLRRFGTPYSIHRVVPFVGDIDPEPVPQSSEVICIGSYSMRHYASRKNWNPGVFDLDGHDFGEQWMHWGDAMLNVDSLVVRFADVRFGGHRFVRPVDDTKAFSGRVFEWSEFAEWQGKVAALEDEPGGSLGPDTLVQVSGPKEIWQEVRCWVVEGQVLTASTYRVGSRVVYSSDVDARYSRFAARLAGVWAPEKAFCLDVCETAEGLKVVEINTINSAGFYAADVQKLVLGLDGLRR